MVGFCRDGHICNVHVDNRNCKITIMHDLHTCVYIYIINVNYIMYITQVVTTSREIHRYVSD